MLKILGQNKPGLMLDINNPYEVIAAVRELVKTEKEITIDISGINLIDACRISTLCSTEQYINNPDFHINWIVSSPTVKNVIKPLVLGNASYICD